MTLLEQHMLLYAGSATVLTAITLCCLRFLSKKIGHRACVIILILLAFRILIPTGFHGMIALPNVKDEDGIQGGEVLILPESQLQDQEGAHSVLDGSEGTVVDSTKNYFAPALLAVWVVGAVAFFVWQLIKQTSCSAVWRSMEQTPDGKLLTVYQKAVLQVKLKKHPKIAVLDADIVPHLCGVLRPVIHMGRYTLCEKEQYYILCHELTHYKRKDPLVKWLLLVTVSVFWWNPLIYYLVRYAEQEIECACDEDVLDGCSVKERLEYGQTVLHVMKAVTDSPALPTCGFGKNDSNVKRFESLLDNGKKRGGGVLLSAFFVLFCVSAVLFGCVSVDPQTEQPIVFYVTSQQEGAFNAQKWMELVKDLSVPPKTGHVHSGWRVENVTDDRGGYSIRFEPVYKAQTYTVTMVLYNGTTKTQTLTFGDELPVPTRAGYTFDGWFRDPVFKLYVGAVPAGECVLYAKWIAQ